MQTIKMDFQSQSTPPVVPVMQSDSQSRFIGLTLYDGGVPYSAPSGAVYTVEYHGQGANNIGWYDTIQLSSGTRKAVVVSSSSPNVVTIELAEQALRVNGEVKISLCVLNNTGYKLNTFPIICRVTGAPYVDPVSVRSYFYVTGLTSDQWMAYVTACQDAQKRAEDAAAKFVTDPTLSLSGKAADAKATGAKTTSNENAITLISAQKGLIDGNINTSKFVQGSHSADKEGNLSYNDANEYAMTTPTEINLKNATSVSFSNFDSYNYAIIITYGTKWIRTPVTSNPFSINSKITKIIFNASRKDEKKITDYDLLNTIVTISSESKVTHLTELADLYNLPKTIKTLKGSSDIIGTENIDAFLINDSIDIDTNANIFSNVYGGNGTLTFTNWNPTNLSNTFKANKNNDYIYKCMHFPHSGTYPNLEYKDPTVDSVSVLPFKLPIGAIYLNTDKGEEFDGIVRIVSTNMYGFKSGQWYELQHGEITWVQIHSLPWGSSSGINVHFINENGTTLIDLKNHKLTKDNVLHFGTSNTYATEFDYYIVKFNVICNKNCCGLKIAIDSRDTISGEPTQIISSRVFEIPDSENLIAFAHNIPDSVYNNVIVNFNDYIKLKLPHFYSGYVEANEPIIYLQKTKNSVTVIKNTATGRENIIIVNNGAVNEDDFNLINVNVKSTRIEITAKSDFTIEMNVSNIDAIANYNYDLI